QRHGGRSDLVRSRDVVEYRENALAAFVQIRAHAAAARAFVEIVGPAIFAGQESVGERVIGNDADFFLDAGRFQFVLVIGALVEIVFRLERLVARQIVLARDRVRFFQARGGKIG